MSSNSKLSADLQRLLKLCQGVAAENAPPALPGERWVERWCGSGMWRGSSIWTTDSDGCYKNMVEHIGGDEETHAAARRIVAAHNASVSQHKVILDRLDWLRQQKSIRAGGVSVPTSALIAIADLIEGNNVMPAEEACDHEWRFSDSSLYDFKCTKCGEVD